MRSAYVSAVLLTSALGACAGDAAGSSSPYELEGRVLDDRSGRGIKDAKVSFSSDTLDRAETRTDGDGRFEFTVEVRDGVRFGTVRASRADYTDSNPRSVYFDDSASLITLRLRAKPNAD